MIEALSRLLEGVSRGELARRSSAVTAQYRSGKGSEFAVRDRLDALAYAAARLPATSAAAGQALARLAEAAPGFAPSSLLDLGAGCGAATLAALDVFPSLARATMVDRNNAMLTLATELCASETVETGAIDRDLRRLDSIASADLVTMAYVLVEMSVADAASLALAAYEMARSALVLVEPGTPAGFERIRAARAALIEAGAFLAAPCPHRLDCPVTPPDWRHFSVRVQRGRDHLAVKGAEVPYEDEPFIYLAATREPVEAHGARVIARPHRDKTGVRAKLCGTDGALRDVFIPARDKTASRAVRRIEEGDLWPL